ncbi:DNA cytosine methyltransferase [Sulfurimonas sp.]|uniref:DNA cytosine methyltransferase n=1 Tax=Sulfurimonas sp. TaxID=2022749 RepID=UPI003D0DA016
MNTQKPKKQNQNTILAVNNVDYKPRVLHTGTAFSGIGAVEEALKNLNIAHINEYMVEIDKYARATYVANHAVNNVFEDITQLDYKNLPKVDFFPFGSPCQSFSMQGKRGGFEDTRGTLFFYGAQVIKHSRPKYFLFENVKGMVSHDKGNTFKIVKATFEELGYKISWKVLNAKHYGAAQNRERLFVIGIRNDIKQEFIFPEPQRVSNCVNNYIEEGTDFSKYLFDSSLMEPFTPKVSTDIHKVGVFPHLKFEYDKKVISSTGISPCFLAGNTKIKFYDQKNNLYRYLTENEMKQIQGFNKDYKFPVSNSQARKQIGNSMYVGVIEAILKNLIPKEYFNTAAVADTNSTLKIGA